MPFLFRDANCLRTQAIGLRLGLLKIRLWVMYRALQLKDLAGKILGHLYCTICVTQPPRDTWYDDGIEEVQIETVLGFAA